MNDLILLAMLLGGPRYGYELKRDAGWITGHGMLHSNFVYPMLRRFLEQAWVTRRAVPGERGQTRQQYSLTRQGQRTLFARVNEFSEADAASRAAFRLRIGLFSVIAPEARENILERRESVLEKRDAKLTAIKSNIAMDRFGKEVVRHMREQIRLEQDWIIRLRRLSLRRLSLRRLSKMSNKRGEKKERV